MCFPLRFNIAADLVDEAKDAGELGFAGILVWMRFMATRQLIWNKNYNVKPRYNCYIYSLQASQSFNLSFGLLQLPDITFTLLVVGQINC